MEFHYIFVYVGMSRGPTSEVEKIKNFKISQKLIKFHEMSGNDQKSVWEYHLGAETIHCGDLGCPGRYSGVLQSDFHVDSQNPKVWRRNFETFPKFPKVTKFHEMTGNDEDSVWEHHLGVGTAIFIDLGGPGRYSGVIDGDFDVDSQNFKVGYGGNFLNIIFEKSRNITK